MTRSEGLEREAVFCFEEGSACREFENRTLGP
jgi:hypothetical protein